MNDQDARGSDKFYFHRYGDFYEEHLPHPDTTQRILEFGVWKGESIRWLSTHYPGALITGLDILPFSNEWPTDERISYIQGDQGDRHQLASLIGHVSGDQGFDLVIEDGSHLPEHQRNALIATFPYMSTGGTYVLEDIHTSFRELRDKGVIKPSLKGPSWLELRWDGIRRRVGLTWGEQRNTVPPIYVNMFSVILAIERSRATGRFLSDYEVRSLTSTGFISSPELMALDIGIRTVALYSRPGMPLACWRCGGADFDPGRLTCACGLGIFTADDSMTAVLIFN